MTTEEPIPHEIRREETPGRWGISFHCPSDPEFDFDQWKTQTFPKLCLENGFIEADWIFEKQYCTEFYSRINNEPLDIKANLILATTYVDPNKGASLQFIPVISGNLGMWKQ